MQSNKYDLTLRLKETCVNKLGLDHLQYVMMQTIKLKSQQHSSPKHQTFEFSDECKVFNFGMNLELISVAAAMCITCEKKTVEIRSVEEKKKSELGQ